MDFYSILGVQKEASDEDIKFAFRKLAKKLHPDVNSQDEFYQEYFKNLNEAYETLSDRMKRIKYNKQTNRPPVAGLSKTSERIIIEKNIIIDKLRKDINDLNRTTHDVKRQYKEEIKEKEAKIKDLHLQLGEKETVVAKTSGSRKYKLMVASLVIAVAFMGFSQYTMKNMLNEQQVQALHTAEQYDRSNITLQQTVLENDRLKDRLQHVSASRPFVIKKIDFYNSTDRETFTNRFEKEEIESIHPRLQIVPVAEESINVPLTVKIVKPSGTYLKQTSAGQGHEDASEVVTVNPFNNMLFLNEIGDTFNSGTYTVEVWHNDQIIGKGEFNVEGQTKKYQDNMVKSLEAKPNYAYNTSPEVSLAEGYSFH
ncbi:MAG: J domain-containing protein [Cyclobacteriaceae bacterium]|nr:J domain-containing protein [Cyclobacteriaceae bacterium]